MYYEYGKMKTQQERVLAYLKEYGSITDHDAREDLGITRLSDVVYKLHKKNIPVISEPMVVKNRYGETCHVVRYTIAPDVIADWEPEYLR